MKQTPRQKMINLMYLVLIAMLALNVSREVLKSFHLFELSFDQANQQLEKKNRGTMAAFEEKLKNERTRVRTEEWYALAREARQISSGFHSLLEKMKGDIIQKGGGRTEPDGGKPDPLAELKNPDDMEGHAYYFMEEGQGHGKKLQTSVNETREKMISLLKNARQGDKVMQTLRSSTRLRADDPQSGQKNRKSWSAVYLEEAPLAGAVTLLTKLQNDCKALEAEVLSVLSENINITSIVNDGQMALIIPENTSVMSGDYFRAKVALATYDTRFSSGMYVNGSPIEVSNGVGEILIRANGTGVHRLQARIESTDPSTGEPVMIESLPVEWNAYQGTAAISADNMNVLFIGLDNPMSVSVPGVTPANTLVTAGNGIRLKPAGNGKYTATAEHGHRSGIITVSARMPDGSIRKMGEKEYRIRKVPVPKMLFGNLPAGVWEKTLLRNQQFLYAHLDDFYFSGVKFSVEKFHALIIGKRTPFQEVRENGSSLAAVNRMIASGTSGDVIVIDEIVIRGPSGIIRPEPLIIRIK